MLHLINKCWKTSLYFFKKKIIINLSLKNHNKSFQVKDQKNITAALSPTWNVSNAAFFWFKGEGQDYRCGKSGKQLGLNRGISGRIRCEKGRLRSKNCKQWQVMRKNLTANFLQIRKFALLILLCHIFAETDTSFLTAYTTDLKCSSTALLYFKWPPLYPQCQEAWLGTAGGKSCSSFSSTSWSNKQASARQ